MSDTNSVIRACFQVPDISDEAYFFADTRYVRIKFKPGTTDDQIVNGPSITIDLWPTLRKIRFATVDAVLPSPNGKGETYFFCGTQYALISVVPTSHGAVITGPKNIVDYWPSLRKAGFNTVDSVLPSPKGDGEAYFFSGTQYVLIKVIPGTTDDYIITGPKSIADYWPSLRQAGFNTINSVLPSLKGNEEVYFFSGTQYALIKVIPGTMDVHIITGPKSVAEYWPSLLQAGFY
ncbi:34910_t:CDS:1 [Gigaspora margarita]|uniref:34910_t:CDS:1 n=1 Tax=Gigaspora margarita TaxID=4874 RepID=A0ABN7X2N1_GIGMA|nr:34910_t:CDS:1 [Gigaspora margarita]